MGGIIALVALLMLMHKARSPTPSGPITPPLFPTPSTPAAPPPAVTPGGFPVPTPAQQIKIANTPPAWPQGRPSDLPPWPSGWTPSTPPTGAQVTRAWQLLPVLWAKGQGASQAELTGGIWTMYIASWMNPTKTMKGVVAFKPKPSASPPPQQPVANA